MLMVIFAAMSQAGGMGEPETSDGIQYVSDDEDEIDDELLQTLDNDAQKHSQDDNDATIQMQIKLCYGCLCVMAVLSLVIMILWNKFGERIGEMQRADAAHNAAEAAAAAASAASGANDEAGAASDAASAASAEEPKPRRAKSPASRAKSPASRKKTV